MHSPKIHRPASSSSSSYRGQPRARPVVLAVLFGVILLAQGAGVTPAAAPDKVAGALRLTNDGMASDAANLTTLHLGGGTRGADLAVGTDGRIVVSGADWSFASLGGRVYARAYGAIPGDGLDDTSALQAAAAAAGTTGVLYIDAGTYETSETLTIQGHVEGLSATIRYAGSDTAIVVRNGTGGTSAAHRMLNLPYVVKVTKTWGGNDVGISIVNLRESHVVVRGVQDFTVGLNVTAESAGNNYNTYSLGGLINNKVNLLAGPSNDGGWVNENLFLGGRFHMNSDEGTSVSGARHILLNTAMNPVNNNVFLRPSVEGNVPEYHVEIYGSHNQLISARWESASAKVHFNHRSSSVYAHSNTILYGYNADALTVTESSYATRNIVFDAQTLRHPTDAVFANQGSSANPTLTVLPPGTFHARDAATEYTVAISSAASKFKRTGDAASRLELDHNNAYIYFGAGASTPTASIRYYGGDIAINGATLWTLNGIRTDTVSENTTAAGVSVDGVLIKDGTIDLASLTLPTCDSTLRGRIQMLEGGAGVADNVYVCVKSAGETYSWKTMATG